MSWEWRIFLSQPLTDPNLEFWTGLIEQPLEERIDRYFVSTEIKFGLKYRDIEGLNLLELKMLEDKNGYIEKWEKYISPEGAFDGIPELKKLVKKMFKQSTIDVKKERKQLLFEKLFVEYTQIEIDNDLIFSFCVEGELREVEKYLISNQESLDKITKKAYAEIKSYPEYLLKYRNFD